MRFALDDETTDWAGGLGGLLADPEPGEKRHPGHSWDPEHDREVQLAASEVEAALLDVLERQERTVIARLTGTKARRGTRHWDPPGEQKVDPRYVLDLERWRQAVRDAVTGPLGRIVGRAASRVQRTIGVRPAATGVPPGRETIVEAAVERLVEAVTQHFTGVQSAIEQAESRGAPMQEVEQAVRDAYAQKDEWARRTGGQAGVSVFNEALLHEAQASGRARVVKIWLSSRDDRVRDEHEEADGQRQPLTEPFDVAGVPMMFPGQQDAPIHLWINCRCSMYFEVHAR